MPPFRATALVASLSLLAGCASIYGITDLPSDDGTDAAPHADAGTPKHDAGRHDATSDAAHEAAGDAPMDAPRDGRQDATSSGDASDATTTADAADGSIDAAPDAPASLLASVLPSPVEVRQGGSASLTVTLKTAALADVQVTLSQLPAGVTAAPLTIPMGQTSGMITVDATASATEGTATATLTADASSQAVSLIVAGSSGTFDTSFNESGVQNITPVGGSGASTAYSVAVQSDGSIVIAGSLGGGPGGAWALVRLLPDGSPDTAFNASVLDSSKGALLPASGSISGAAIVPGTGLIAVAGLDADAGFTQLGIVLYNTDGTRHQSFGTAGLYQRGPSVAFHVSSVGGVAVNPAGAIAVVGNAGTGGYLITLSGATNSAFDESTNFPTGDAIQGVAYEPNGDIVVGGSSPSGGGQFFLTRFTSGLAAAGLVDGGVLGPPSTSNEYLTAANLSAVVCDPSGNVFLIGTDDKLDPVPAMTYVPITGGSPLANGYTKPGPNVMNGTGYVAGASSADGRAVLIGNGYDQAGNITFVVRVTSAGMLDPTFASAGLLEPPANMTGPLFDSVAIDPVGRIVVVGNGGVGFYVMRIWP
jgi:uncharacterized delta-60 repeat protein